MKTLLLILLTVLLSLSARAEDWTINYKTFRNVIVKQAFDDHVAITFDGGVGNIRLAEMPPDLQARFHYDASKAKIAELEAENARLKAQASLPVRAPVPVVVEVRPPAPKGMTQEEIDIVNARINVLTADMDEKRRIQKGHGFDDLIRADSAEITMLTRQLAQDKALKVTAKSY